MNKINVLIIGNTSSSGWNLKIGLEQFDEVGRVDVVFDSHPTIDGIPTPKEGLLNPNEYDVIHYHYPFIKTFIKYYNYIKNAKILVCHWRGTDLRGKDFKFPLNYIYPLIHNYTKSWFFKHADFHFYSTYDLAWWLRSIPSNKKSHLFQVVDTDQFKPINCKKKGVFRNKGGAFGYKENKITHDEMPTYMNQFKKAEIIPGAGLDVHTIQVTHLEAAACGLQVKWHEHLDRDWVLYNASIPVFSTKVITTYICLLNKKGVNGHGDY